MTTIYPSNGRTCSTHKQLIDMIDAASIRAEAAVARAAAAVQQSASVENQILVLQKDLLAIVADLQDQTRQVIATQKEHTEALRQANETILFTRGVLQAAVEALPRKKGRAG